LVIEQGGKRDLTIADPELVKRHGPQPQATDSPSARVSSLLVSWLGGPGEDELTWIHTFVNRATNVIPNLWLELPLVDESWSVALEDQPRTQLGSFTGRSIDVEEHLALGNLASGLGLSTGLRALKEDCASCS
jgi:hypothetical protein